ncbi:uncharacterized protein DNG_03717 [Cephalotrichum gorgonifer]|uniref:Uncharacterized protein n=1 Tax=Cephalotrichum gorgonifer TaxID=2041049 RepID=A0AAE8MUP6_9PEZI|nr:uncharacterized protein DNG_03717 [Cephalotrichum gorgonifer]
MTSTNSKAKPPLLRCDSPPPEMTPAPAIGARPTLTRCLSSASFASYGSSSDATGRDSLGSDTSFLSTGSSRSRSSDVSTLSRKSSFTFGEKGKRRGFVRPQGTDFAASARSRESVLSLGSITHIQHYFARTGLLDGKGATLARKRKQQGSLDIADLDSNPVSPALTEPGTYSSSLTIPQSSDFANPSFGSSHLVESPVDDGPYPNDYYDDLDEQDSEMLPPTVSTYHRVEKPIQRPPTLEELKAELKDALATAYKALVEVMELNSSSGRRNSEAKNTNSPQVKSKALGWFEVQGMHILDVMTLAIRAAKVYYTTHEKPDRLDAIKPEKEVRADLLSVMEVLKQAATREFVGGIRNSEVAAMETWLNGVSDMLKCEEEIEESERLERAGWTWLKGDWAGREVERELAFIASMDPDAAPLPEWTPAAGATELPTPFLEEMRNGLRLVKLHNAAVQKSQRRFGAIPTFHTDTQKPYRCADNIRYWAKAGELRWEVYLRVDALGIVYNNGPQAWLDFEAAILRWCRKVREEITAELGKEAA